MSDMGIVISVMKLASVSLAPESHGVLTLLNMVGDKGVGITITVVKKRVSSRILGGGGGVLGSIYIYIYINAYMHVYKNIYIHTCAPRILWEMWWGFQTVSKYLL